MAGSVATRAWRPSALERLDEDLTDLWREVARDAPVSRAVMSNLVVFCRTSGDLDVATLPADLPIEAVAGQHPARIIVLYHDAAAEGRDAGRGPRTLDARVGVLTFGAPESRYGVEEIVIRSACDEAALPSIVRALMHGDVPTSIWWTEDLSRTPPVDALMEMGRQLVYDSRTWRDVRQGVRALAPLVQHPGTVDLADVNWRRLSALRQALVHAAKSGGVGSFTAADVRIVHRPGEGALAWLLAGWLGSRLPGASAGTIPVRVDERRHGDEILAIEIGNGQGAISATMNAQRVVVTIAGGAPPFHLAVRRESDADAVVAELTSLNADLCLLDTLAALTRHFST
jgi:glucose-6-phosphate dehydrogenase assembly protein OpcA